MSGSAGAGVLCVSLDAGEDADQAAVFVRALRAATGHGGPRTRAPWRAAVSWC